MKELGIAGVKVERLDGLPNIYQDAQRYNFDFSAFNWPAITNSDFMPPVLIENITDHTNAFACCYLAKRKHYVDNYIKKSGSEDTTSDQDPRVTWTAISKSELASSVGQQSVINDFVSKLSEYTLIQPDQYTSENLKDYTGPVFADSVLSRKIEPNDCNVLMAYKNVIGNVFDKTTHENFDNICPKATTSSTATESSTTVELVAKTNYVHQTAVGDGLWWAMESSACLTDTNTPFWVDFKKMESPTSAKNETVIVISIAPQDTTNWYDIVIRQGARPIIIDYYGNVSSDYKNAYINSSTISGSTQPPPPRADFPQDLSRTIDVQKDLEIGVMVIAGRLVVYVNKVPVVYTRFEKQGTNKGQFKEAKIPTGKIVVFATNITACVNVSPMTFAKLGLMSTPIATLPKNVKYQGVTNKFEFDRTTGKLPKQPDQNPSQQKGSSNQNSSIPDLYGVDCKTYYDDSVSKTDQPKSQFFQTKGNVCFTNLSTTGQQTEGVDGKDLYVMLLEPETGKFADKDILFSRTPFFFRIKGGAEVKGKESYKATELDDVLSVTETAEAPDYFHFKKSATVVLYNKGGKYDYLRDSQYGIRLEWKWDPYDTGGQTVGIGTSKRTFTGLIINANSGEIAGKETMTLQCQDYMYILQNNPIINSPFYDGMLSFYAIKDLALRATIGVIKDDTDKVDKYFLPSGYGFTKPAVKYPSEQMIFDCMIDIVKRHEAFIYFDENGEFHVARLPGGLFSADASSLVAGKFYRDPKSDKNVILDTKEVEFDFDSTKNRISVLTVERDSRTPVLYTNSPESMDMVNIIPHKKVLLYNQAALGGLAEAIEYATNLGVRIFRPIRKTSFKTAGGLSSLLPFDFITVDGLEFRLMSISRSFNAESNDFTNTYNSEWLGG